MSTFYDLPKSSVAVFKASDPSDVFRILFASLKTEKKSLICHKAFAMWYRDFYANFDGEYIEFSENDKNFDDVASSSAGDVIFADFDVFSMLFRLPETLRTIQTLKSKNRVFIVTSSEFPPSPHLEQITDATFQIKRTENPEIFECSAASFDKKGNFTVTDQLITVPSSGAKPTFKIVKKSEVPAENEVPIAIPSGAEIANAAIDLPFFVSRQEDGVAIRDAATKKIRIGGRIVYEPDQEDDLDDSDPDDDLNI